MAVHQRTGAQYPDCASLGWNTWACWSITALPSSIESSGPPGRDDRVLLGGGLRCPVSPTGCGSPDWPTSCRPLRETRSDLRI